MSLEEVFLELTTDTTSVKPEKKIGFFKKLNKKKELEDQSEEEQMIEEDLEEKSESEVVEKENEDEGNL